MSSAYSELRHYLKNLTFEDRNKDYSSNFDFKSLVKRFLTLGDQFFYVVDFVKTDIVFLSSGFEKVLGYKPEEATMDLFYEIIHPKDKDLIFKATKRSVEIAYQPPYEKPFEHVFYMDYRVRRKSGDYIRILRQTCSIKSSDKGYPVLTLGICTDISHLKKSNCRPDFKVTGPYADLMNFPGFEPLEAPFPKLTNREKEILRLIAKGRKNKDIAAKLFLSEETVKTHRKNLKKKMNAKTTGDMILKGATQGVI